ncbi:hypothetical protein C2W62_08990 [Candidatus Entotheonella serta]|nr:hypothetical protein C2W62_08990 [Candidatus Entotheonella serta]
MHFLGLEMSDKPLRHTGLSEVVASLPLRETPAREHWAATIRAAAKFAAAWPPAAMRWRPRCKRQLEGEEKEGLTVVEQFYNLAAESPH